MAITVAGSPRLFSISRCLDVSLEVGEHDISHKMHTVCYPYSCGYDIKFLRFIWSVNQYSSHDDVIKWKNFQRYWPFVRTIHRSPVNSPHEGQWRRALMFTWKMSIFTNLADKYVLESIFWWIYISVRCYVCKPHDVPPMFSLSVQTDIELFTMPTLRSRWLL